MSDNRVTSTQPARKSGSEQTADLCLHFSACRDFNIAVGGLLDRDLAVDFDSSGDELTDLTIRQLQVLLRGRHRLVSDPAKSRIAAQCSCEKVWSVQFFGTTKFPTTGHTGTA